MNVRYLLFLILLLTSCSQLDVYEQTLLESPDTKSGIILNPINSDLPMLLGQKLENPYTVENMRNAYLELENEGVILDLPITSISTTHYYLCYKPNSVQELNDLEEIKSLELFDFPCDYEVIRSGHYYRKSDLLDSIPTWRYSTVSVQEWPMVQDSLIMYNIDYEVLDSLYMYYESSTIQRGLSEESSNLVMFDLLEQKSFEITENNDGGNNATNRAARWTPSGRIMAYDNISGDYIPLENVKVIAFNFCWRTVGYTDSLGYFQCDKSTRNNVKYKIKWESNRWDIRDGTTGQANYNDGVKRRGEWNLNISLDNYKSIRYTAIHRALQRMYYGNNVGLSRPNNNRKAKISYYHYEGDALGLFYQRWFGGIMPDIKIYGVESGAYRPLSAIFSTTSHEIGHMAHFTNAEDVYENSTEFVCESWARYVQYVLTYKEYEELGLLGTLDPVFGIPLEGGYGQSFPMITPDIQYNFQYWNNTFTDLYNYSPIFIDLTDTYNQRDYYRYNNALENYIEDIPEDLIHGIPSGMMEDLVFQSTTQQQFKQLLLSNVSMAMRLYQTRYNATNQTINKLFEVYE